MQMNLPMGLYPSFKKILQKELKLKKTDGVLLAVSGGIDSMVMLHLFHRFGKEFPLRVTVAHLNHNVRGRASAGDARFVEQAARSFGISFEGKTLPAGFFGKGNFQDKARRARYEFFKRVAKRHGIRWIATAHQADDQVETFFMRLIRGVGPGALLGIPLCRPLEEGSKILLIRPLIFFSRSEILAYARKNRIAWREDRSNQKEDYFRNQVRRRLLKPIERWNPQAVKGIAHFLRSIHEEGRVVDEWVERSFPKHLIKKPEELRIGLLWLQRQPSPLRFRIYRKMFQRLRGDRGGIYRVHLEATDQLVRDSSRKGRVTLPQGVGAYLHSKYLVFKCWRSGKKLKKRGFFY